MLTKKEFLDRRNRRQLSRKEQERRWLDYKNQHEGKHFSFIPDGKRNVSKSVPDELSAALYSLAPCSVHYAQALADPFHLKKAACVPDLHVLASRKFSTLYRDNFATGTNGQGYVILNPHCKTNNGVLGAKTIGGIVSDTISYVNATGMRSQISNSKFPYANGDFSSEAVQGRVVGVGLRIRYIGPEVSRSGQVVALRHPDNANLSGELLSNLKTYRVAGVFPVDRNWTYLNFTPVKPAEYEYSNSGDADGTSAVDFSMIIAVLGTTDNTGAPASSPFEFEVISHIEYIGNIPSITTSHSDISGLSQIRNAQPTSSATMNPGHLLKDTLMSVGSSVMKNSAPAITSGLTQGVVSTIADTLLNPVSSFMDIPELAHSGMTSLMHTLEGGVADAIPLLEGEMPWLGPIVEELPMMEEGLALALV